MDYWSSLPFRKPSLITSAQHVGINVIRITTLSMFLCIEMIRICFSWKIFAATSGLASCLCFSQSWLTLVEVCRCHKPIGSRLLPVVLPVSDWCTRFHSQTSTPPAVCCSANHTRPIMAQSCMQPLVSFAAWLKHIPTGRLRNISTFTFAVSKRLQSGRRLHLFSYFYWVLW